MSYSLDITSHEPLPDSVASALWDAGATGIWEISPRRWKAYFPLPVDGLSALVEGVSGGLRASWEREPEVDWVARYQESLRPFPVGRRFVVLPSEDLPNPYTGRLPLRLVPGMAFGTGEHFTTASCLRLIESLTPMPESLLDVGCGSGILALGASLAGISRVAGCDTDAVAVRAARENATRCGARIHFAVGACTVFRSTYDCVVANIQAEVLADMMPDLVRCSAEGGSLILAGILAEREGIVLDRAREAGLTISEFRSDGRWSTFLLGR